MTGLEALIRLWHPGCLGPDDPALAEGRFHPVDGHRIEQPLTFDDGGYRARPVTLTLDRSAGVVTEIPADRLEALFAIDGARPPRPRWLTPDIVDGSPNGMRRGDG